MIVTQYFREIVGGSVGSGRVENFRKISGVDFGPRNFREIFDQVPQISVVTTGKLCNAPTKT
jgi:hypothetical protein